MDIGILQNIWFVLIAVLLSLFLVLGGFDFGACMLAFRSRRGADYAIRSIAPFWDGNQVWLITTGGALFAAFPAAYSTALSNLYTPVMLLLAAIVIRVAAIEFYFTKDSRRWRQFWRFAGCAGSALTILLIGVALGVVFNGLITGRPQGFIPSMLGLFTAMTVLSGVSLLLFCCVHGGLFLCARSSEGVELFYSYVRVCFWLLMAAFAAYLFLFIQKTQGIVMPAATAALLLCAYVMFSKKKFLYGMLCTSVFMIVAIAMHAAWAYPGIIPPQVTIQDSSGTKTLGIMLGVAGVGVPLILAYTAYEYSVFLRKKKPQVITAPTQTHE